MKHKKSIKILSAVTACVALCLVCMLSACKSSASVVGISINGSDEGISAFVGEKVAIKADVEMSDGSRYGGNVDWALSREGVITQSPDDAGGVFLAESAGEVEVTASVPGTGYFASCVVVVTEPETVFTVGVKDDVENFGYRDPVTGEYTGFEIDLAKMLGGALGYDTVKTVPVTPEKREEKLQNGEVDCVIATYSITEEREQLVNFSDPYYTDYVRALKRDSYGDTEDVTCASLSDITEYVISTDEGDGVTPCRVGTVTGSTAYQSFTDYCEATQFDEDTDNDVLTENPKTGERYYVNATYDDYRACEKALAEEQIDLFIADSSILLSHTPDGAIFLDDGLEAQDYGVATAKGDTAEGEEETELTKAVNALISEWLEDGTIDGLLIDWKITV